MKFCKTCGKKTDVAKLKHEGNMDWCMQGNEKWPTGVVLCSHLIKCKQEGAQERG